MSLPLSLSSSLSSHSLSSFSRNRPSLFSLHLSQNPNRLHFRLCAAASAAPADTGTLAKSAIQRIAEKLRTLGFVEETAGSDSDDRVKAGEIFIPNSRQIPNYRVGHTLDPSWSTPQNPVPEPGTGGAITRFHQLRGEVVMEKRKLKERKGEEERVPTVAEVVLPGAELRRLRTVGIGLKRKMKIGKAGITEGIVNGIHERWRSEEVVKIVCEDICRLNMKRTHELLERKTGGMVVWRAGGKIVLYRGVNYKYPYFTLDEASPNTSSVDKMGRDGGIEGQEESGSSAMNQVESAGLNATRRLAESSLIQGVGQPSRVRFQLPGEKQLVEEADRLLDGLGPRFIDWWGYDPIPVDADLLPAVVSGYRRPFRLLPFGVKPKLTNDEMTILKRLGRPLPCHFALGRNRKLQGLAAAILKLWERCEIAKIAVKRGVQNTNSELMAEELKRLTGGTLLSRDKEYIVFYRGKDFLPLAVSSAIEERRRNRMQGTRTHDSSMMTSEDSGTETAAPASVVGSEMTENNMENQEEKTKSAETTRTSRKLAMALGKKARAEKLLAKLEQAEISRPIEVDREGITEEERYMLRRVGLKMKPFLLLGRRGVFDGTIENMHLHWKYRELVKIICGGRNVDEIHRLARILETESGGILVAVERVRKGHAIIVYRGKNYQRPAALRPSTLLNKKEAMKRSLEAQRRESLKLHVLKLTRNIEGLKLKLVKDKEAHGVQLDDHLTSRSDMDVDVLTPTVPGKVVNSQMDSLNTIHQEKLDMTPSHEHETCEAGQKSLLGFVCLESNVDSVSEAKRDQMLDSACHCDSKASCSDNVNSSSDNVSNDSSLSDSLSNQLAIMTGEVSTDSCDNPVSNDEMIKTSSELYKNEQLSSFHERKDSGSNGLSPRPLPLSNKERLLLRKQALKMKRPPLLAIGKSNVVTGVVKAIKDHFKKHPLVIVNVKGRAKGTSVQEVVFKLEQATGGVLVSQEPSKIILYRGWGGKVESGSCGSKRYDHDKGGSPPPLAVPPQLMEAMRLELGLPSD